MILMVEKGETNNILFMLEKTYIRRIFFLASLFFTIILIWEYIIQYQEERAKV